MYFVIVGRRHPGRETDVEPLPEGEDPDSVADDTDTEADSTPTATEDDSEASTGETSKAESPT